MYLSLGMGFKAIYLVKYLPGRIKIFKISPVRSPTQLRKRTWYHKLRYLFFCQKLTYSDTFWINSKLKACIYHLQWVLRLYTWIKFCQVGSKSSRYHLSGHRHSCESIPCVISYSTLFSVKNQCIWILFCIISKFKAYIYPLE